jgi:predicted small lipoprotein YifL
MKGIVVAVVLLAMLGSLASCDKVGNLGQNAQTPKIPVKANADVVQVITVDKEVNPKKAV